MASLFAYRCGRCDRLHEGPPHLDFEGPWFPNEGTEPVLRQTLEDGVWVVERSSRTDRHLFGRLALPVHGLIEAFTWGVWVQVSEADHVQFQQNRHNPVFEACFFGTLANAIPGYPDSTRLRAAIHLRTGTPSWVELEHGAPHPLAQDAENGLPLARAQERFEACIHRAAPFTEKGPGVN